MIYFFIIISTITSIAAQENNLQAVTGLPSRELFNLFMDSKGFLWIGHSLGISKYDGFSFKNYFHKDQISPGVTDILEDKQGRIWCHNFSGQIFYIQNDKIQLLDAYKFAEETSFPRIIILNDELLVTSDKGLFICNTKNLECKYIQTEDKTGSNTICLINNRVILYNLKDWMEYEQGKGLKHLNFKNTFQAGFIPKTSIQLQPLISKDTGYAKGYMQALQYLVKFNIRSDTVVLCAAKHYPSIINNITQYKNEIWCNCLKQSENIFSNDSITGMNLTSVVIDKEGNRWYSSLTNGLFVKPKVQPYTILPIKSESIDDKVMSVCDGDKIHIVGTEKGRLIYNDLNGKISSVQLPTEAGEVENIFHLGKDKFFIAPTHGAYIFSAKEKKYNLISTQSTTKCIALCDSSIFIGYPEFLAKIVLPMSLIKSIRYDVNYKLTDYDIDLISSQIKNETKVINKRCYELESDSITHTCYALCKDALYSINFSASSTKYLLYNSSAIHSSCIAIHKGILYIGTYNNGLLLFHNGAMQKVALNDDVEEDMILDMKTSDNKLLIVGANKLEVFDLSARFLKYSFLIPLNRGRSPAITDFNDSVIRLYDKYEVFNINYTNNNYLETPNISLQSVQINNSNELDNFPNLNYNENDITLTVSSPSLLNARQTYFKYRLLGSYNLAWYQTKPGNNTISFKSLKPGQYTVEVKALNFSSFSTSATLKINFIIKDPWWHTYWFYCCLIIFLLTAGYFIFKFYVSELNKSNQRKVEKFSMQSELRNSMLTAIKAQMNPHFIFNALNTLQNYIYNNDRKSASKYLGKFSDMIREVLDSSNEELITLQKTIEVLQLYVDIEKDRFHNQIKININIDTALALEELFIPPMLLQPFVENAIKHGLMHKTGNKELNIYFNKNAELFFEIIIDDNGVGRERSEQINLQRKNHISFANTANSRRIDIINQMLGENKIELKILDNKDNNGNATGTTVILLIPTDLKKQIGKKQPQKV